MPILAVCITTSQIKLYGRDIFTGCFRSATNNFSCRIVADLKSIPHCQGNGALSHFKYFTLYRISFAIATILHLKEKIIIFTLDTFTIHNFFAY